MGRQRKTPKGQCRRCMAMRNTAILPFVVFRDSEDYEIFHQRYYRSGIHHQGYSKDDLPPNKGAGAICEAIWKFIGSLQSINTKRRMHQCTNPLVRKDGASFQPSFSPQLSFSLLGVNFIPPPDASRSTPTNEVLSEGRRLVVPWAKKSECSVFSWKGSREGPFLFDGKVLLTDKVDQDLANTKLHSW